MASCKREDEPAEKYYMPPKKDTRQLNTPFRFDGFHTPNYTQVPDQLFDELLSVLSGAELKVLLYICRRTFGFKKDSDNISINQMLNGIRKKDGSRLDGGVGLSKPTLLRALKSLKAKNIIITERRKDVVKGDLATNYRLLINDTPGKKMNQGEAQNFTTLPGSEIDHQQETVEQKTEAALVVQLLDFGIDKPTVDRLIKNHDGQLIVQKIDYVTFMQEEQSHQVRNPRGWLLKAIEHDYGPPAGYRPRAEREAKKTQLEKRKQATEEVVARSRQSQQAFMDKSHRERQKLLAAAQETYHTTEADIKLWQEILDELKQRVSNLTYELVKQNQLLTTDDGTAIIGSPNSLSVSCLKDRFTTELPEIFARCGRPVEAIQVIHLHPEQT